MNLQDTRSRYGAVSILAHWLGAACVLALLGIGLWFEDLPRGDERLYWLRLHVAIGALAFLPLALRVLWRAYSVSPRPLSGSPLMQHAASALHALLLAALAALIVSGPLTVWSGGRAIGVFGWFELASPMGKLPALHEALENIHGVAAKALLFALAAHVLAALKHAFVDRDGTLWRMLGREGMALRRAPSPDGR